MIASACVHFCSIFFSPSTFFSSDGWRARGHPPLRRQCRPLIADTAMEQPRRVVVIGGGLAGLATAFYLDQPPHHTPLIQETPTTLVCPRVCPPPNPRWSQDALVPRCSLRGEAVANQELGSAVRVTVLEAGPAFGGWAQARERTQMGE